MVCDFCAGISIELLVELARVEFSANQFPQQAYYRHQPSYANLILSAQNGCRLCELICHGLQELVIPYTPWEGMTRSQIVSEFKSDGESSDIKISIHSQQLYSDTPLDQVELLDVLMVQVGTPERFGTPITSDVEDPIPPLKLALTVPLWKPQRVGKYRIGRYQLDPDLGSIQNSSIATRWLEDCRTLHKGCPNKHLSKLPTRVLDVGPSDEPTNPRLLLSEGIQARYAALSHCWGGEVWPRLTTENIDSFRKAIPLSDLPANFRDAIFLTKQLGIQYLWIDALCIEQDSKEDWEAESQKMGSVYKDSTITISATMSGRSTDGFLGQKFPPNIFKDNVELKIWTDQASDARIKVNLKNEEEENLSRLFRTCPWNKRGWTLQESVISPRVLYFGERQIYWKCLQGFQSADGVTSAILMPESELYPEILKVIHSQTLDISERHQPDLATVMDNYCELVKNYNSRILSFNSDKFPAFSGLAALIHPTIGGEYLAGIWSEDFRRGLVWTTEMEECRHTLSDQAPSWSWAVTNDPVRYYPIERKRAASPDDAQLLGHNIELKSANIYGPVDSGRLIIGGLTKPLVRSTQSFDFQLDRVNCPYTVWFDEKEGSETNVRPEVVEITDDSEFYLLCLYSGSSGPYKEIDWEDIDPDLYESQEYLVLLLETFTQDFEGTAFLYATCLILKRTAEELASYTRLGYMESKLKTLERFEAWKNKGWERRAVDII